MINRTRKSKKMNSNAITFNEKNQKIVEAYETSLELAIIPNLGLLNDSELTMPRLKFCYDQAMANYNLRNLKKLKNIQFFWMSRTVKNSILDGVPENLVWRIICFISRIDHMEFSFFNEQIAACFDTFKSVIYGNIIKEKESQMREEEYNRIYNEKISLLGFSDSLEDNIESQLELLDSHVLAEQFEQEKLKRTNGILMELYNTFSKKLGEDEASLLKTKFVSEVMAQVKKENSV